MTELQLATPATESLTQCHPDDAALASTMQPCAHQEALWWSPGWWFCTAVVLQQDRPFRPNLARLEVKACLFKAP